MLDSCVELIASSLRLDLGLRCGDVAAASSALEGASSSTDGPTEAPIRRIIAQLRQRQGNASCIWESGPPMISMQDRQALADLYEHANNFEPEDVYRVGTLALLSGIRAIPTSEARGFSTIEDYLFGSLWVAMQHQNPMNEIVNLGGFIRGFGPDHFTDEDSGGWSYALPLMVSQQFKSALSYVADVGGPTGLLQATHLGLVLNLGGAAIEDIGQDLSSECILSALLVAYASKLCTQSPAGPKAALEYLRKIPSQSRVRKEV